MDIGQLSTLEAYVEALIAERFEQEVEILMPGWQMDWAHISTAWRNDEMASGSVPALLHAVSAGQPCI